VDDVMSSRPVDDGLNLWQQFLRIVFAARSPNFLYGLFQAVFPFPITESASFILPCPFQD